jgi:hypothetical protein
MPKFDPEHYLSVESYAEALETFHAISGIILFEFARQEQGERDVIIRNFIARTDMMARAVFRLWELQDYQDCWILHRCLLDRLFHLSHLQEHDQFEVFEAWSFLEQYNALNRVRSAPEFSGALESKMFNLTLDQKERAKVLSKNPPVWQRPKAEKVAKRLNMRFLYRFGYDFGSTHVHPMANDGQQDFFTITKLEPAPEFPDQRSVLSNTLLVGTMIVQQGLNASTLSWRALVYDFLDDLRRFLDTGSDDYKLTFVKLGRLIEQGVWLCKSETVHPMGDVLSSNDL